MKKIVWLFCLLFVGCSVESESELAEANDNPLVSINCITCRDILGGEKFSSETACPGTKVLWNRVVGFACRNGSQCQKECKSLCSFEGIDLACESCLLLPKSRQDYLNCDMVGNQ